MKTNIDNLLKTIFENNLESVVKAQMLKDGYSSEQIDAHILQQKTEFELRQKQNDKYSGVNWEDPELAMCQVEAINEYHSMMECQQEQEEQQHWEEEQAFYAGGCEYE